MIICFVVVVMFLNCAMEKMTNLNKTIWNYLILYTFQLFIHLKMSRYQTIFQLWISFVSQLPLFHIGKLHMHNVW